MIGLDLYTAAATLAMDGILVLADIGLAAGAKLRVSRTEFIFCSANYFGEVRLLLLAWLFLFGLHILVSVVVPPLVIAVGFTASTFFADSAAGSSGNHFTFLLHFIANIDSYRFGCQHYYGNESVCYRKSHIMFFVYHSVVFLLGLFYIYIWCVVRSLYYSIDRTGRVQPESLVHYK